MEPRPRCDGEIATKTREVGESGDEIQLLQASIESGEAAVAAHKEKLQGVLAEMAKWSAQKEMLGETTHSEKLWKLWKLS